MNSKIHGFNLHIFVKASMFEFVVFYPFESEFVVSSLLYIKLLQRCYPIKLFLINTESCSGFVQHRRKFFLELSELTVIS